MDGLTMTLSFVAASCAALALWRRAALSISRRQAEFLKLELAAAIQNAGSAEALELCSRYRRCSLARIAAEVVLKSRQLGSSAATRSEILRIILNQACLHETHRINRASAMLRAVAFLSAAIGMMLATWNVRDSFGFVILCVPELSRMATDISEALASLISVIFSSLSTYLLYKYLEASSRAEILRLRDDSSGLLCAFLSRRER
jgi:hypothetical protein